MGSLLLFAFPCIHDFQWLSRFSIYFSRCTKLRFHLAERCSLQLATHSRDTPTHVALPPHTRGSSESGRKHTQQGFAVSCSALRSVGRNRDVVIWFLMRKL